MIKLFLFLFLFFHNTISQNAYDPLYRECLRDKIGVTYHGFKQVTASGRKCDLWTKYPQLSDTKFPYDGSSKASAENFCRNPDSQPNGPWCYYQGEKETCGIPYCECRINKAGIDYRAKINKTRSGNACTPWNFRMGSTKEDQNYCRNPPRRVLEEPWCYIVNKIIEYCDIPACDCMVDEVGIYYRGEASITNSGKTCQAWSSNLTPHTINEKYSVELTAPGINFCRNLFGEKSAPWCYTTDPNVEWEYCGVINCNCRMDLKGHSFTGKTNYSKTGYPCKKWSDYPDFPDESFPDKSRVNAGNYCRNPYSLTVDSPWCFVDSNKPDVKWEYCNTPMCDCQRYKHGREYVGTVSVTKSGRICQRWSVDFPHKVHSGITDEEFADGNKQAANNFCRNPTDWYGEEAWCYTTDPLVERDFCDLIKCECGSNRRGVDYAGRKNRTISGKTCQRWDSTQPNDATQDIPDDSFPEFSKTLASNYCRNPKGFEKFAPWCFTVETSEVKWELCDVPMCDCVDFAGDRKYMGERNTGRSGYVCRSWNAPDAPIPAKLLPDSAFPEKSKNAAKNYCRNVNNKRGPWCYILNGRVPWEECDLSLCNCVEKNNYKAYLGKEMKTKTGKLCNLWKNVLDLKNEAFPENSAIAAGRFCRVVTGMAPVKPWCFVGSGGVWEECQVQDC